MRDRQTSQGGSVPCDDEMGRTRFGKEEIGARLLQLAESLSNKGERGMGGTGSFVVDPVKSSIPG